MIQSKQEYLHVLKNELKNYSNSEEILQEFDMHISELLVDLYDLAGANEEVAITKVIERVGSPVEVAALYKQELEVTPAKTQWTFILGNLLFFIGGICITAFYHLSAISFFDTLWSFLTNIPFVLIALYMLFWALLGYEIGKEFGLSGKKLLVKTFYISLVPNLVLMGLVVFKIVPVEWFHPLLTKTFMLICIFCTILLYPISYLAYRWGTNRSV